MTDGQLLAKIMQEYNLGYNYVQPLRQLYRQRILRFNPQSKKDTKININMIANAIDTKIASTWNNGLNVKFISSVGWIGEEEADNLTRVAKFDEKETARQQIKYQIEQDSWFFGVGILNKTGWDKTKSNNTWRSINPLSWIPDPLPSQTGQFDGQNYRFHGFMMRSNVFDVKNRFDKNVVNEYFAKQYNSDEQQTRQAYTSRGGYGPLTCDNLTDNFSIELYTHYTIVDGKKHKVVTDGKMGHIFENEELLPVLKEERLDAMLIPRPVMLNYTDPVRESAFGNSICDKLEDKQNAKSVLYNLNVIKAKKEALGGDFLVNSRLIKNKDDLKKSTSDTRYLFIDEDTIGNNPIQNAMYELPQSPIKSDVFAMMTAIDNEAEKDVNIDNLQNGIVPDKSMTKAEAQTIQGNANAKIRKELGIKQWFYEGMYFQRWRGYQEHFTAGKKKFALLASDFEWKGVTYTKDDFLSSQIPYIMIGTEDELNAINEQRKAYLNMILPQIKQDPNIPKVSKAIFQRLVHKVNGIQPNIINIIEPYSPSETKAKDFIDMINLGIKPKSIFENSNADFFAYYLYIQKAQDGDIKEEILAAISQYLMEQGMQTSMQGDNGIANSAANIMMSQGQQNTQGQAVDRSNLQPNQ